MKFRQRSPAELGKPVSASRSWIVALAHVLFLVTATVGLGRAGISQTIRQDDKFQMQGAQMSQADDRERKGRELRAALDKFYARLPLTKKGFSLPPTPGTDVANILKQYIPAGMSFDDAEAILQQAGFVVVQPRKQEPPQRYTDSLPTYDVVGELQAVTSDALMKAHAVLRPQKIMDYGAVGEVFGRMTKEHR